MQNRFSTALRRAVFVLLSCIVLFASANAQQYIGRQKVDQYPCTAWGTMTYGLTWLPADYTANPTKSYPLIIFLHGKGETGDGISGLNALITTALPMHIANGWDPAAVNPVDGQTYKFIVVSPQAPFSSQWSYTWSNVQYILQDVLNRYRVDLSRIYVTGLSAGGNGAWTCVTSGPSAAKKFAAMAAVSSASVALDSIPKVGSQYGVKLWQVCGDQDPFYSFVTSSTTSYNSGSPTPSPIATVTPMAGQAHWSSVWNTAYDPNWRSNAHNKNLYEWLIQYKRTDVSGSGGGGNTNQAPTANAGADQTITLPTSSISLAGSATDVDGTIASYAWTQVSGPSTASIVSPSSASTSVNALVQGTYTFRLTATDNAGATGTDDVVITVNAAGGGGGSTTHIEAENYATMSGIGTETTQDVGGGLNVGWQDNGDWMNYSINPSSSGQYTAKFRVASYFTGATFQVRKSDGTVLATVTCPNTGSFQTWTTISSNISLTAGAQTLRIYTSAANGGWNINWFELVSNSGGTNQAPTANAGADQTITLPTNTASLAGSATDADGTIASYAWTQVSGPSTATIVSPATASTSVNALVQGTYTFRLTATDNGGATGSDDMIVTVNAAGGGGGAASSLHIEAESYTSMNGVGTEPTLDAGGGLNVGWQDTGDWMDYSVNVSSAGTYTVKFRVASYFTGATFQLKNSAGTVLATMTCPNTGNFQYWTSITASVSLPAGQQTLRIYTSAANGGWNINWFEINSGTASRSNGSGDTQTEILTTTALENALSIYPNPVKDRFVMQLKNDYTGVLKIELVNMAGAVVKQFSLNKPTVGNSQFYMTLNNLESGQYILKMTLKDQSITKTLVKQ